MALAVYSDLTTAIANWLARVGDTQITSNADDFVTLAEQRIAYGSEDPQFPSKPLRIRAMETSADIVIGTPITGSTVGGTANAITLTPTSSISAYTSGLLYQFAASANNTGAVTLNVSSVGATSVTKGASRAALVANDIVSGATYNAYYDAINAVWVLLQDIAHAPLPPNYLAMRSFFYFWSSNNLIRDLDYLAPTIFNTLYVDQIAGSPQQYTIEQDQLRFGRVPDATYFGKCLYYQKFSTLKTATTNWLFTNAPGVYLDGSLLEASIFLEDDEGAARYHRRYMAWTNALASQDLDDRHSGASLQIRNTTGNP